MTSILVAWILATLILAPWILVALMDLAMTPTLAVYSAAMQVLALILTTI